MPATPVEYIPAFFITIIGIAYLYNQWQMRGLNG